MHDLANARRSEPVHYRGALYGLAAAALFGVSTPFAKLLLPDIGPVALASLLYLGAALALSSASFLRRADSPTAESPLQRADIPVLLAITASGGILAPLLMLHGLGHLSGVAASLMLNLEAPFTILIAVFLFGEHLGRREALAAMLIVGGALTLTGSFQDVAGESVGAVAIAGACLCWALDNNLTQRLSLRDPIAIVRMKALGAGIGNLII